MTGNSPQPPDTTGRRWLALVLLFALAAFMYLSIGYKIINYGP